ncbi:hypothetical protein CRENBAI_008007 [Crenichthys baileyi]|uniref:Transposase n=1 Tax=Crenichthys baileyi TaxID=28760 RepID=A0AAV9S208_9TELE
MAAGVENLDWPAQSPDINLLWDKLEQRLQFCSSSSSRRALRAGSDAFWELIRAFYGLIADESQQIQERGGR